VDASLEHVDQGLFDQGVELIDRSKRVFQLFERAQEIPNFLFIY